MAKLSVNVNKIATLRNQRALDYPSPVRFAEIALRAGAAGITVHPRPDQRHIRPHDVTELGDLLSRGTWNDREFNIEGNPFHGYLPLVVAARPDQCTLVPDDVNQSTSDHGFDLTGDNARLKDILAQLRPHCTRISLFMDPDERQIELAASLGVDRVELYTEPYASAHASGQYGAVLSKYVRAADCARAAGLGVNAGHDLTLVNLPPLVSAIPFIAEVSIGHALIADALEFGLAETVRRYIRAAAVA